MHNFVTLGYLVQCPVVKKNQEILRNLTVNLSVSLNVGLLETDIKKTFVCNRCGSVFVSQQRRRNNYASCKFPLKPGKAPRTTIPQ